LEIAVQAAAVVHIERVDLELVRKSSGIRVVYVIGDAL